MMAPGAGGSVWLAVLTLLARAAAAIVIGLIFGLVFLTAPKAAPPPGVDVDSELGDYYRGLQWRDSDGDLRSCCGTGDCRRTFVRRAGAGWEAFIDQRFPSYPKERAGIWAPVPPERVTHQTNQAGEPVICWNGSTIICFNPLPEA